MGSCAFTYSHKHTQSYTGCIRPTLPSVLKINTPIRNPMPSDGRLMRLSFSTVLL